VRVLAVDSVAVPVGGQLRQRGAMLRTIGSVVLGYVAISVFVFLAFTISYLAMGADRAFAPSSYDVTRLWLIVAFVVNFVAAFIGGRVCAVISKSAGAVMGLATVVLLLGVLLAYPTLTASSDPIVRPADVSSTEAMTKAQQPAWVALVLPWIGLAGVMVGGRTK
jgi:hypothetical protein